MLVLWVHGDIMGQGPERSRDMKATYSDSYNLIDIVVSFLLSFRFNGEERWREAVPVSWLVLRVRMKKMIERQDAQSR